MSWTQLSGFLTQRRHLGLSTNVEQREMVQLDLSKEEREALVAFMETLTDHKLIQDKRFSDPFKR